MKARISTKGRNILKNSTASRALVYAIVTNPEKFSNGQAVEFQKLRPGVTVTVQKVSSR